MLVQFQEGTVSPQLFILEVRRSSYARFTPSAQRYCFSISCGFFFHVFDGCICFLFLLISMAASYYSHTLDQVTEAQGFLYSCCDELCISYVREVLASGICLCNNRRHCLNLGGFFSGRGYFLDSLSALCFPSLHFLTFLQKLTHCAPSCFYILFPILLSTSRLPTFPLPLFSRDCFVPALMVARIQFLCQFLRYIYFSLLWWPKKIPSFLFLKGFSFLISLPLYGPCFQYQFAFSSLPDVNEMLELPKVFFSPDF